MKRIVEVVITKEYEIEINDSLLNQEFVTAFEKDFWELKGDSLDEKLSDLFGVVAREIAHGENNFIEGVGPCSSKGMKVFKERNGSEMSAVFDEIWDETEVNVEDV